MKNISIKWKIFIFLMEFCFVIFILLFLFQIVFLNKFYKNIKINEMKNNAEIIEKKIDNEDLGEVLQQISWNNNMCIEILSEEGRVLYSDNNFRASVIHTMLPIGKLNLYLKALRNGGEFLEYNKGDIFIGNGIENSKIIGKSLLEEVFIGKDLIVMGQTDESTIYSKIITNRQGQRMMLLVDFIIPPLDATATTLRVQLYYVTGFMLIFAIILAFVIAKRVSEPIEKMNKSAKKLAKGDYSTEFEGNGYKEIGELSDTLNYTAKELSKVERLRQELIGNISHDLRTPLTLISGYAEAMRDLPNENNPENAQIIVDETKRLTTLVNDVMSISKLQAGGHSLSFTTFNLTQSIHNTISRMKKLVKKDGYTIQFIFDREISVTADEPKVSQVFYNLLINAINYTGKDKMIFIKQTVVDGSVKIEVCDTGEGISQEALPYIWERYYKVDKTHKRAIIGTGLGLSIVKSIIELHGGEYGVSSKVNEGSVFWFTLKI